MSSRHLKPAVPDGPLGAPIPWPDGKHVAANGGPRIFLWDVRTGRCSGMLETSAIHSPPMFRLASEPVLGRVLEAHGLRGFAVWDSQDWKCLQTFVGHGEPVRAAAFVGEDRIVSISGDSTVQLWDAWTGASLRVFEHRVPHALASHPAKSLVAISGLRGSIVMLEGHTLEIRAGFDLPMVAARYEQRGQGQEGRPTHRIHALAWHPDGEHLLGGGGDFVTRMFHGHTGRVVSEWHGHSDEVVDVAVSAERGLLCTGSYDGTVRIWSLQGTECLSVHDLGHSDLGGLCITDGALYVTMRSELRVIPLP
ncbi:transcriptional regulator [Myxococcus stipitatus]|uniref:WD40 repeat domain-containing protein n=1 Tax=Myxococcus stipitatus TaxID=83455 RepID=UPI0031454637